MDSPFKDSQNKIEVAKNTIINMLDNLEESDYFGLVLFDDVAEVCIDL